MSKYLKFVSILYMGVSAYLLLDWFLISKITQVLLSTGIYSLVKKLIIYPNNLINSEVSYVVFALAGIAFGILAFKAADWVRLNQKQGHVVWISLILWSFFVAFSNMLHPLPDFFPPFGINIPDLSFFWALTYLVAYVWTWRTKR